MRKLLLLIGILVITASSAFATKFPEEVRGYIEQNVPNAEIRFDGVIIFPSNTFYLPLYPSLFSDIKNLSIKFDQIFMCKFNKFSSGMTQMSQEIRLFSQKL